MNLSIYFFDVALICAIWAIVSAVLLTRYLDQRGIKTSFPFIGALIFRNLSYYKKITLQEKGKVGPLYYSYLISINLALILSLTGLIFIK
jgi:hypothetical protein